MKISKRLQMLTIAVITVSPSIAGANAVLCNTLFDIELFELEATSGMFGNDNKPLKSGKCFIYNREFNPRDAEIIDNNFGHKHLQIKFQGHLYWINRIDMGIGPNY